MTESFKPYVFSEAGDWRGIDLDIVKELYAELGIVPTFVPMPWAQQLRLAERGILDAVLTVYCDETSPALHIPKEPLYQVSISLFAKTGKPEPKGNTEPELGSSVGIVRSNFFVTLLENRDELDISLANSAPQLVEQLVAGRLDYVLEEDLPFLSYASERGYRFLVDERRVLKRLDVCLAFAVNGEVGQDTAFFQRAEAVLKELKADGRIDAIISRYVL